MVETGTGVDTLLEEYDLRFLHVGASGEMTCRALCNAPLLPPIDPAMFRLGDDDDEAPLGWRVKKTFHGYGKYEGTVEAPARKRGKTLWYFVRWHDGSTSTMTRDTIVRHRCRGEEGGGQARAGGT